MRISPLHDEHLRRVGSDKVWTSIAGMRMPDAFPGTGDTARLALADVSHRVRTGLKGPGAATQLSALGLPLPAEPNRWLPLPQGGLVARLGFTEYFIEDEGSIAGNVSTASLNAGSYRVLRTDTALALSGRDAGDLLAQVCSVNFAAIDVDAGELAMTSMAGVSVLVIAQRAREGPIYRIWCDPSYGPYLYRTLLGIVEELGGGPIGMAGLDRLALRPPDSNEPDSNKSDSNPQAGKS